MTGRELLKKEYIPEELSIRLSGRVFFRDKVLYLLHSASYLEFDFEGRMLEAEMESEGGDEVYQAWIGIYADDMEKPLRRINLLSGCRRYPLWDSDNIEKVRIRIVKLSESQYASTAIHKLIMDEAAQVHRTPGKKKRLEVIGDSITCGFGNEGKAGDVFKTETENPLKAYAALAAKKLDYDFTLTAWSGIGILSSWIPPETEVPNTEVLAPAIYPYVDFSLFQRKGWTPNELYDYERDNCNLLVLNLGTNDASYTREDPARKQAFQTAYQDFLRYLRSTHKDIPIICTSNALTDLLNSEIEVAVENRKEEERDKLIYHMAFSYQEAEDGEGAVGHPSLQRHEKMAEQLADWIRRNIE